ncbi:MAG: S41 family peptidase [Caulobacter sp.]
MTTKSKLLAAALGALVLAGAAAPGFAQPPATPPAAVAPAASLTPAQRAAVLAEIRAKVSQLYVFPERRAAIVAALTNAEKAGRYNLDSSAAFAEAVSEDLAASSHDKHMYLLADPAEYAALSAPAATAEAEAQAFWRERALSDNHGLTEMKILPGNVRYLKIAGFHWIDDETGQAYDDAMRFLRGGDAVVIDLRGNGGGSGAAVNYLTSHFMKPGALLLTFTRASETPEQSRAREFLPAGRLIGKPLYVLTDGGCFSACEEFAYHVQQFRLGERIGTTTGGGANNNDQMPIAPGFVLSVSAGRPVHAVSGTNWEGVGVKPDVDASPTQALDVALKRALTGLAASTTATARQRENYAWALIDAEARLRPVTLAPERLQALAGRYGGAEISFRDGSLWLTRADRPERQLIPLDDKGLFAAEGAANLRARFVPGALELTWQGDPEPVRLARH